MALLSAVCRAAASVAWALAMRSAAALRCAVAARSASAAARWAAVALAAAALSSAARSAARSFSMDGAVCQDFLEACGLEVSWEAGGAGGVMCVLCWRIRVCLVSLMVSRMNDGGVSWVASLSLKMRRAATFGDVGPARAAVLRYVSS